MNSPFFKYFFSYVFKARTRQRLLYLSSLGLALSSFALLVLQSSMGGLQGKLIERSKSVNGSLIVYIGEESQDKLFEIDDLVDQFGARAIREYEIELLVKHRNYLSPAIIHGIDTDFQLPNFLSGMKLNDLVLPYEFISRLNVAKGDTIRLISPAHVDTFLDDIPRSVSGRISGVVGTDIPEVDAVHIWSRLGLIQNLIGKPLINRYRIFEGDNLSLLSRNLKKIDGVSVKTWEELNSTLVWALSLETTVMVFLFVVMTLLVSLCITSGLLIFLGKIKLDLASFWILGGGKEELEKTTSKFLLILNFLSTIVGLALGVVFLLLFDYFAPEILPDVFVDRKIPIEITPLGLLISFIIPFGISELFSFLTLKQFKEDNSFLEHVRTIG